jgi:hypothetical protein
MTIRKKTTILDNISTDLGDNNAGLISAEDVRTNMYDAVDSINLIISSGNVDTTYPFVGSNVRAAKKDESFGVFIAESGVHFQDGKTQIFAYPGPFGINHPDLGQLDIGDPHAQYLPVDGERWMEGPLRMNSNANSWIGSSGYQEFGLSFQQHDNIPMQQINVGSGTQFQFNTDGSRLDTAKGMAKAWLNFEGSGNDLAASPTQAIPVVRSSYNIHALEYMAQGKYKVTFTSGTFLDNSYVAIGNSNAIGASGSPEDFDVNTVGLVMREGDDLNNLRTITYLVKSDDNEYVDAEINDLVVFGLGSGTTADSAPTINPS